MLGQLVIHNAITWANHRFILTGFKVGEFLVETGRIDVLFSQLLVSTMIRGYCRSSISTLFSNNTSPNSIQPDGADDNHHDGDCYGDDGSDDDDDDD